MSGTRARLLLCVIACLFVASAAQAADSYIEGEVLDPLGTLRPGARVIIEHRETGERLETRTDGSGLFRVRVAPGCYLVRVLLEAFAPAAQEVDVRPHSIEVLSFQLHYRFEEAPVPVTIAVRPDTDRLRLRNADGSFGATFPRTERDRMILSAGRTLASFACVTPSVTCTEQTGTGAQWSGGGQRRDANDVRVDGAPMNLMPDATNVMTGPGVNDAYPATAVDGSTTTLVPLEAVDEIIVRTAGAAPAHRRTPGAQMDITTRAGGDRPSGSVLFDRRLDGLSAPDWFDERAGRPRRAIAFTNASGALGGPLWPTRLFHFTVGDMHRLNRPVETTTTTPSAAVRALAPPSIARLLRSYPEPNGPEGAGGWAEHTNRFPAQSQLAVVSSRVDARLSSAAFLFGRGSIGRSTGDEVDPLHLRPRLSYNEEGTTSTKLLTVGFTAAHSSTVLHEGRVNISRQGTTLTAGPVSVGHANPLAFDDLTPPGISPSATWLSVSLAGAEHGFLAGGIANTARQTQFYAEDAWTFYRGSQRIGMGIDVRESVTAATPPGLQLSYRLPSPAMVAQQQGGALLTLVRALPTRARYRSVSMFLQDVVDLSSRVTLTGGVHYSIRPAPRSLTGVEPEPLAYEALPEVQRRPAGAPLWRTSYTDVAPMVGAKIAIRTQPGRETILHASAGRTYDDITSPAAVAFRGAPFLSTQFIKSPVFPLRTEDLIASLSAPGQPLEYVAIADDLRRPRTDELQIGIEQALGSAQRVSATYVHAAGRDLIYSSRNYAGQLRTDRVSMFSNDGRSDYEAVSIQWRARSRHVHASVDYTWSRMLDNDSGEGFRLSHRPPPSPALLALGSQRGSADYSRPHMLFSTVSIRPPTPTHGPRLVQTLCADLQFDITGRLGSGVAATVFGTRDLGYGLYAFRPDVVPGVPTWISDSTSPNGRRLNPDAFRWPTEPRQGTHARNSVRGLPVQQVDIAASRIVRLGHRATLHFRLEVYNLLNETNFGPPHTDLGSVDSGTTPRFGEPLMSYATALGAGTLSGGGLAPYRQVGAPRSMHVRLGVRF